MSRAQRRIFTNARTKDYLTNLANVSFRYRISPILYCQHKGFYELSEHDRYKDFIINSLRFTSPSSVSVIIGKPGVGPRTGTVNIEVGAWSDTRAVEPVRVSTYAYVRVFPIKACNIFRM